MNNNIEKIENLENRIRKIIEQEYYCNSSNDYSEIGIEIYCDYRDELGDNAIKKIINSNDPRMCFEEILYNYATDYGFDYGFDELIQNIESKLTEEEYELYEKNEDEIRDYIHGIVYFYYPEEHFNKSVKVNIMLDTGNMNYDFTRDNVLNWYASQGYSEGNGSFNKESSLLWLAKQQQKAELLQKCCKKSMKKYHNGEQKYREQTDCEDKFVVSAMEELANMTSHIGTMTFLVEMNLFDYFDLKEAMKKEEKLNQSYYLEERKGNGYIVLDKSTMCGLFDTWQGGGSLLEIQCEKDIKIPIRCIFDAIIDGTKKYGYDVDEVYGLIGSCWRNTLKEIHKMEM